MPVFFSHLNDIVRTAHQQCINARTERDTAIVAVPLNRAHTERKSEKENERTNCRDSHYNLLACASHARLVRRQMIYPPRASNALFPTFRAIPTLIIGSSHK